MHPNIACLCVKVQYDYERLLRVFFKNQKLTQLVWLKIISWWGQCVLFLSEKKHRGCN